MTDFSVPLHAVSESFLQPLGPIAEAQRDHLIQVVLLTLIAVVPVMIAVPTILWRYRRGNRQADYRPDWESNPILEVLMWGVPVIVVILLSIGLWRATWRLDPYAALGEEPLRIDVVGLDWKWVFLYPEQGVATVDELIIPAGRAVKLRLTTDTVMQSFRVSALAGQIYAMPGMTTELNLLADRAGEARGRNTQFTGTGFWEQRFEVRAVSPNQFKETMATARKSPRSLTTGTYAHLAKQGTLKDARAALGVAEGEHLWLQLPDPAFFEHIVDRYHDGAPLAEARQPGSPHYRPDTAPPPAPSTRR